LQPSTSKRANSRDLPSLTVSGLSIYRRLLGYARPHWPMFLLGVVGMILFAAVDTGLAWLVKEFLDDAFVERDRRVMTLVPVGILVLFSARGLGDYLSVFAPGWVGRHVIKAISMFQEMNDPPMKTVVGLSNISNGCPKHIRPILNKYFFVMLMNAGLTSAIADAHEMAEAMNEKKLIDDVLAGKKIDDANKMTEITKTVDVIMGNTLYAHSYLEM